MQDLRIRAQYTKTGDLRFISHLDLTRVMERAIKRARLPIAYSEGFHPMPKIAYGPALALGIASRVELLDLQFLTPVSPEEAKTRLNQVLPAECRVLSAATVPLGEPALTAFIDQSSYTVTVDLKVVPGASTLPERIQDILERDTVIVTREKKGKRRQVDIRPYILELSASEEQGAMVVDFLLQVGSEGATNPREVLALFGFDLATPGVFVQRTGLFASTAEGRETLCL